MENTLNNTNVSGNQFGQSGRDYSVDILRVFSCYMVIFIHSITFTLDYRYNLVDAGTGTYYLLSYLRLAFTSPTILFVMVSGIFFLTPSRNVTIKKIWTKNIPKLAAAYVFWSYAYAYFTLKWYSPEVAINFKSLTIEAIHEPTPLWYIPMLIGLYMMTPVVRVITKHADIKVMKYALIIFIVASFIYTLDRMPHLPYYQSYIDLLIPKFPFGEYTRYLSYFLMGYYFYTHRPNKKTRYILYASAIVVSLIALGVTYWMYVAYGDTSIGLLAKKFTLFSFVTKTAVFILFVTFFSQFKFGDTFKRVLTKVSNCTLIIYLSHWLLLEYFHDHKVFYGLLENTNVVLLVFVYSVVIFIIGLIFSLIFQAVPWKKIKNRIRDQIFNKGTQDVKKYEQK